MNGYDDPLVNPGSLPSMVDSQDILISIKCEELSIPELGAGVGVGSWNLKILALF